MENITKSSTNFTKVKPKKNLYKNNKELLNSPFNQKNLDESIKNKFIKRSIAEQKNLDFINNSDFIKELVANSKLRKLKKNLDYKHTNNNNNTEIYNMLSQRTEDTNSFPMNNDFIIENKHKKVIYNINELNSNENNSIQKYNSIYSNNNDYSSTTVNNENKKINLFEYNNITPDYYSNKTLRENHSIIFNQDLNKNKNIMIIEGDNNRDGNTYRKNYFSIEKLLKNKNKKNKSSQKDYKYNTSNSFLNVTVNQIKESPFYDKIKVPKMGHSRGIIEMIKNFKDSSFNNGNIINNNRKKSNENNASKKMVKCLNDQKVFDEPKNKKGMNRNYSYKKKILKSKNATNTKKKNNLKKITNKTNNEDLIKNRNKNQSFNNNYQVKKPLLTMKEDLVNNTMIINNKNENKEDILNNFFVKKDNYLYKKYTNNNYYLKKNNNFNKKKNNNRVINIKYSHIQNQNNSESYNIDINKNLNITEDSNVNILNKTKSESESDIIKQRNSVIGSPILNNKMKNYRNQYLNDNLEDDFLFYQTLPILTRTLKRNDSTSSRNSHKIKEIQLNMKNKVNKFEQEKENSIYNNTKNYFYSGENFSFLKDNNNKEKNIQNIINKNQKLLENQKKLVKTYSTINFNKKNLLYLKPKNKINQNLKSFYFYNYNTTHNSNNNSNIKPKNMLSSPVIKNRFNESNPISTKKDLTDNFQNNDINNNINKEYELLNKEIRKISLSKEKKKIYKKPIKKNINNTKMSPKYKENIIDSNSLTHKDEIIYMDKTNNSINVSNNIQFRNKTNLFDGYNKPFNSNNSYGNIVNIINKTIKYGFIKKYYNHCIKFPKKKNNYLSKEYIFNFNKKKGGKNIILLKPNIDKCYFTKISIVLNDKNKEKEINQIKGKNNNNDNSKTPKIKKNNKNKEKNNKSSKINKNRLNIYKSNEKNNDINNIDNINEEKINRNVNKKEKKMTKYKIKTQNDSIKNEVIYLLNILVQKNILSIENQLTKLIITSSHLFNIEKNEDNSKLFLNDIMKNENIFIDILLNKIIIENKFNEIYSKLCSDLCNKYLNSINEIIINKFIGNKDNKDKYDIIKNLKSKLNDKCIMKLQYILNLDINNENKQKITYLINFVCLTLDYGIIEYETCSSIIYNLINEYEKNKDSNNKYHYLDLILYFMLKIEKIENLKDKKSIIEKISNIINSDINSNNEINTPNIIKTRLNKFKKLFNIKNSIDNKEQINFDDTALLIKEDMENYFTYLKNKEIDLKIKICENVEYQYNWPILKSLKKLDLEDIIKYYINICEYTIKNNEQVTCYKSYIKYIIETISFKLSLNKLRTFHNKILQVLSDINNICNKNKYLYEIIGYLLYVLIINELCDIKDINIFINKDEESKIAICKAIKYTILSSEENRNKFYEEYKNIDLFKDNDIFGQYITLELKDIIK